MMTKPKQFAWMLLGLLALVQGPGCASSYHRYSDCSGVNCRYCEPAPLPYPHYPGCVCHSKPGSRYLSAPATHQVDESRSDQETINSEVSEERNIEASEAEQSTSSVFDVSQRPYDD